MRPTETNRLFNRALLGGVLLVASGMTNAGCNIFERYERKPAPDVITDPDKMVPDHLDQGEPAPPIPDGYSANHFSMSTLHISKKVHLGRTNNDHS